MGVRFGAMFLHDSWALEVSAESKWLQLGAKLRRVSSF
jgi:hypothetical protein